MTRRLIAAGTIYVAAPTNSAPDLVSRSITDDSVVLAMLTEPTMGLALKSLRVRMSGSVYVLKVGLKPSVSHVSLKPVETTIRTNALVVPSVTSIMSVSAESVSHHAALKVHMVRCVARAQTAASLVAVSAQDKSVILEHETTVDQLGCAA